MEKGGVTLAFDLCNVWERTEPSGVTIQEKMKELS